MSRSSGSGNQFLHRLLILSSHGKMLWNLPSLARVYRNFSKFLKNIHFQWIPYILVSFHLDYNFKKMFSGTVKILDLNDYIKPAEECVILTGNKVSDQDIVELPDLIKSKETKAEIRLDDCLACSGCITTSETILIQEQSIEKLKADIGQFSEKILLISPQSRLSFAQKYKMSEKDSHSFLMDIGKSLGFTYVLDF